jgi:2-octaprenyl-6-methoxyphenol hydroxylase
MTARSTFDCIVVGGGPAGLAAAAALASKGIDVAMTDAAAQGPEPQSEHAGGGALDMPTETRTAALFPPAIAMLQRLGAWDAAAPLCAPLAGIRIIDATGQLLRAPAVLFKASDIGRGDLGFNVPNAGLAAALLAAVRALGVTILADGKVLSTREDDQFRALELSGRRTVRARLVVAADGRHSTLREAAGISTSRWTYDQAALATRFSHSRGHSGISTELHGPEGPCTTVPLGERVSSLVWMDKPDVIAHLAAVPADDFLGRLGQRLDGLLGTLSDLGPRRVFPLAGLVAQTMGQGRIALVGESAHAMPPIGAQGLNLGLSDAATLADLVAEQARLGSDIGSAILLAAYDRARSTDVHRRVNAVDLLNRSVRPSLWPLGLARGAGLHVLAAMPALRRRLMHEGLFPPPPIPSLMATSDHAGIPGIAAPARHPAT